MRVIKIGANLNALTAILVAAVSLSLGSRAMAQAQTTNLSSMSLQAWQMPPAQTHGGPGPHPVQINEQNINVADQEAVVNGCAASITQIIVQTSLNFNLILQDFPQTPFDSSQLLTDLDFSKIVPLDKLPFPIPAPPGPGVDFTNQTAVETSININEPGATPPAQPPPGINLTVTGINGNNVSEVEQANLNVASQVVTVNGSLGSLDQVILQDAVNFSLTLPFVPGQPFDLAALINGLDFVTPIQVTARHTDGAGCPQGPGAPMMSVVDQTIIQTALNFNILNVSSDSDLPILHQMSENVGVQQVTVVPEPGNLALLGMGLPCLMTFRRRSKKQRG